MPPRSDSPRPTIATANDPLTSTTWRFEDVSGASRPSLLIRPNRVTNMARWFPSWRELQGLRPAVADHPAPLLALRSDDQRGRQIHRVVAVPAETPGRVRGCGFRVHARPGRRRPPASRTQWGSIRLSNDRHGTSAFSIVFGVVKTGVAVANRLAAAAPATGNRVAGRERVEGNPATLIFQ
jgi:hypothetical protein